MWRPVLLSAYRPPWFRFDSVGLSAGFLASVRQQEGNRLVVDLGGTREGFVAATDLRSDQVVGGFVAKCLPPLDGPRAIVSDLQTRMRGGTPETGSYGLADVVLSDNRVQRVAETLLLLNRAEGGCRDQEIISSLAPSRRDVLKEKMPGELVEVTYVGRDVRFGLALVEDDRIDVQLRLLDLGEHAVAYRPTVVDGMETLESLTLQGEFMSQVE